ncbi:unnamed protein product [Tuber melanosporum]|uniref:(Perigord truffle) hypothetical protein n=1 Tax=Tuber melanosporum (strain Mel28) TaxID=656061 RepID=D5GMQ7_TUBMM|nr:uncharacterized protein GSTUM_00010888001 [Tuber melanosporum]CAZ85800.1 unnamed protein product [Tuber melanosporum]
MDEPEDGNIRNAQNNIQDADLSDETQDFRFLNLLNKTGTTALPRRGEKDFEPDGTDLQDRVLNESRQAMHEALLGERKHSSKQHVSATWRPSQRMAEVHVARGPHFKTVGKADRRGVLWLLPEETIYLVERGNLECWWEEGVPMSLQGVYASALDGCGGLERYQVYTYLKRAGYILARAPTFFHDDDKVVEREERGEGIIGTIRPATTTPPGIFKQLFTSLFLTRTKPPPFGPVIAQGTYRTYDSIYSRLSIIPTHHPPHTPTNMVAVASETPFRIAYKVWKPQPHFRKSDPPPADFLVAVASARETSLPTLSQLSALFDSVPVDEKTGGKSQFRRLKDGHRKCLVSQSWDTEVTTFIKFAHVGFWVGPIFYGKREGEGWREIGRWCRRERTRQR